jgi:Cu/Ag efflux protein CusF
MGACGKDKDKGSAAPAATYTVRGVLKSMPDDKGAVSIHHEAIPDFATQQGKATGMASMTMSFGVDSKVSLDGFAAGDKAKFTLAVDWQRKPAIYVTAVSKLPAETQLELAGR